MTKTDLVKEVAVFVVGAGISQIVAGIVDANVPQTKVSQKLLVTAGKAGISMVISDAARTSINTRVDVAATWLAKNLSK